MSLISKLSGSSGSVESGNSLTGDKSVRFLGDRLTPPMVLANTGRCAFSRGLRGVKGSF